MHAFSVDYRKDEPNPTARVDRGFWLRDLPRPAVLCRLLGHKPVVDGTAATYNMAGSRWVCCDRCGTRPDPQGHLDPAVWDIGDRYTGPHGPARQYPKARSTPEETVAAVASYVHPPIPGPWSRKLTWTLGGQAILGRSHPGWSAEIKVGNRASEHTLAAHIHLHPFGALYLHTEKLGTWLQRRLNPTGYDSRVTGIATQFGGIDWNLWANRNERSRTAPWWMHGTIKLDPRDKLLGRLRYDYDDTGDKVTAMVRLPHGDDHTVTLQLQRCTYGRNRRRFHSWTVDWTCQDGITTRPYCGDVYGSGVTVSQAAVDNNTWPTEAAAAITLQITEMRSRSAMRHLPGTEEPADPQPVRAETTSRVLNDSSRDLQATDSAAPAETPSEPRRTT